MAKKKCILIISYILIVAGISVWIPYVYLKYTRGDISYYPYLAIHLACIIGGSRLKKTAEDKKKTFPEKRLGKAGKIILIIGVIAGIKFFIFKYGLKNEINTTLYFSIFLPFIITGGIMMAISARKK